MKYGKKGHSGTVDFTGKGMSIFTDMEVFKGQGNDTEVLRLTAFGEV